jgi:hypothetical protein
MRPLDEAARARFAEGPSRRSGGKIQSRERLALALAVASAKTIYERVDD